jgi:hypothetical protein
MTQYSGLLYAMERQEKRAFLDGYEAWQNRNPVASTAAYFLPFGVGSALSLADAGRSFSKGNIMGGIGNTLLAGASFIPGGGILGQGIVRGGKAIARLLRLGKAGGRLSRVAAAGSRVAPKIINANNRMAGFTAPIRGWKPTTAAVGLTVGGGMMEAGQGGGTPYGPGNYHGPNLNARMAEPFDEAGFFTPRSGPPMFRGLAAFNPGANRNTLPFGG